MKNTKTLFIGGVKSGKSANAEKFTLKLSKNKPIYLATTEFIDDEMQEKINAHKKNRSNSFVTIEESLKLHEAITNINGVVLVECVSMWINNMLYHDYNFEDITKEIKSILAQDKTIVFVLNDVGNSILPENKLAREFINISGKIAQLIASSCDGVYHNIAGISTKIK